MSIVLIALQITQGPPAVGTSSTATLLFEANKPGTTFSCQLTNQGENWLHSVTKNTQHVHPKHLCKLSFHSSSFPWNTKCVSLAVERLFGGSIVKLDVWPFFTCCDVADFLCR